MGSEMCIRDSYWPIYVSDVVACHCMTSPRQRSGSSKVRMLKAEVMETMYGCVTCSPTDCSAASDGREYVATVITCYRVQTTMGKRRILFAGFVARMDNERLPKRNERLPKRVMFGEV